MSSAHCPLSPDGSTNSRFKVQLTGLPPLYHNRSTIFLYFQFLLPLALLFLQKGSYIQAANCAHHWHWIWQCWELGIYYFIVSGHLDCRPARTRVRFNIDLASPLCLWCYCTVEKVAKIMVAISNRRIFSHVSINLRHLLKQIMHRKVEFLNTAILTFPCNNIIQLLTLWLFITSST